MRDVVEAGVAEASESELLLEDVSWIFEKEDRKKVVVGVCEYE